MPCTTISPLELPSLCVQNVVAVVEYRQHPYNYIIHVCFYNVVAVVAVVMLPKIHCQVPLYSNYHCYAFRMLLLLLAAVVLLPARYYPLTTIPKCSECCCSSGGGTDTRVPPTPL
jgi:hypothetical protein